MLQHQSSTAGDGSEQCIMDDKYFEFRQYKSRTKRRKFLLVVLLVVLAFAVSILPFVYGQVRFRWSWQKADVGGCRVAWGTMFFERIEVALAESDQAACWQVSSRIDCYPEPGASQELCQARGCCWRAPDGDGSKRQENATEGHEAGNVQHLGVPMCFYSIGKSRKTYVFATLFSQTGKTVV